MEFFSSPLMFIHERIPLFRCQPLSRNTCSISTQVLIHKEAKMYDTSTYQPSLVRFLLIVFHALSLYPHVHSLVASTTVRNESDADRQSLLCLKSQLHDPSGALASWRNDSSTFCNWHGVTCSTRYVSRVIALDLESQNISGQIFPCIAHLSSLTKIHMPNNQLNGDLSPEIGHLTELRYINLSMNSISGEIPKTISSCSKLKTIDLSSNSLGGMIPPSLAQCSSLQQLILSNNNIHGSIPSHFGLLHNLTVLSISNNILTGSTPQFLGSMKSLVHLNLLNNSLNGEIPPSLFNSTTLSYISLSVNKISGSMPIFSQISSPLQHLGLSDNELSGEIPTSIGNLSSLSSLTLAYNNLQGSIPDGLSKIPTLTELDLTRNNLSGIVPPELYMIPSLVYLYLGDNQLTGTIPSDIGHRLPNIMELVLQGNQLEGPIPASLANATNLQLLYLRGNKFTGVIPSLGSLSKLTHLELGDNRLQAGDWSFLSSLTKCTQLEQLWLDRNILQGILPSSITSLSKTLEVLVVIENNISGVIPSEIGKLTGLTILQMDRNILSGHIPETLGNLKNLSLLSLSQNKLSGDIPQSIGTLVQLTELHLEVNNLTGTIPPSLAGCVHLVLLNLSRNSFYGSITHELFSIESLSKDLDLSYNQFTGQIPLEIGNLINLNSFSISNNQLSGKIPDTLGKCVLLESLHLEANFLQGSIPVSLSSLRGIVEIDLSQNNLSGKIPQYFENFSSLQILNLSFNDLEGAVPKGGVFANSSAVCIQGNKKLCVTSPMLQLPLCMASPSKSKTSYIFIILVPLSTIVLVTLACVATMHLKKRREYIKPMNQSCKEVKNFSYDDLFQATDGFSSAALIGSGRFGLVYRGQFKCELRTVAIKVFRLDQFGAPKNFVAECQALRNIRHRNLIGVISVCSTFDQTGNEFKALILEYMANGSLESWLHPKASEQCPKRPLGLGSRIAIALDIAAALDYLHNQCTPPLVHCDLKPSNILLDEEMVACLTDFGLAKFLYSDFSTGFSNTSSIHGPRGSVGYIAPEYGMNCKISVEGDIYSYGIIILEMITGRRPTDEIFSDGIDLHTYVESALTEKFCEILEPNIIVDPEGEDTTQSMAEMLGCAMQLTKLGLKCSKTSPKDRLSMEDVYAEIVAIKEKFSTLLN